MSKIIHSTYEIVKIIGSGGGGVVYLANHLNLNKKIVLKADKRKITTRPELLRREVDVMKNLSHTYIPQVYDFFIENDTVYTAIDYIEGESFDKPLKRGEKFSQPQVIKWARQLLEALDYLHTPTHGEPPKGYVHSDIKPANLMRTPNNDICLIDFNIALALGEINLVGHSIGYASPEHYGIDYSSGGSEDTSKSNTIIDKKVIDTLDHTVTEDSDSAYEKGTSLEDECDFCHPISISNKSNSLNDTTYIDDTISDKTYTKKSKLSGSTVLEDGSESIGSIKISQITMDSKKIADEETEYIVDRVEKTVIESKNPKSPTFKLTEQQVGISKQSSVSSRRKIMPDVRSDIYMVGATLYHLLSGTRPAKDALEVVPLSENEFSPQIVDIISKAMNPNPDLRFQSAAEMLYALNHLHPSDVRYIKFKKKRKISLSILSFTLVIGVFSAFVGLKRIQTTQLWKNYVSSSNEAYENGDVDEAINHALNAITNKKGIFTPSQLPSAQLALTNALGVYDLSDGYKSFRTVELPSELLYLEMSPRGDTALCIYAFEIAIINTANGSVIDTLPVIDSALAEAKYVDNDHIIYAGVDGLTKYCISTRKIEWSDNLATSVDISGNGKTVAAIYRDDSSAYVYDTEYGNIINSVKFNGQKQWVAVNDVFANPNDNIFSLNYDGSILALSFTDGSVKLFDLIEGNKPITLMSSNDEYTHFEGGFYQNYFAFSASSKSESVFAIIDTDTMEQTGGFQSDSTFSVFADELGIKVQTDNILVRIDPITGEQFPLVTYNEPIWRYYCDDEHTIVASKSEFSFFDSIPIQMSSYKSNTRPDFVHISNGIAMVGSMDSSSIRILNYESHSESIMFQYDLSCDHLEARVSHDQNTLMLFKYSQFSLYDKNGSVITSVEIPNPEQVYDQQYIRNADSSYLEVIYNDGKKVAYDAENGEMIHETQGEIPDLTLYEEFETESYKIVCPLHGRPEVHSKKKEKLLSLLKEDAFLTYATEVKGYLIVQYLTADGYRYGQILDSDFEIIAQLPYLCDVIDNKLLFDYPSGVVCVSQIYQLDQLVELAKD